MRSRLSYYLGITELNKLCRACGGGDLLLDLRHVRVAYPIGIVALVLFTHQRGRDGKSTKLAVPRSSDVLNYLERVNFFESLHPSVHLNKDVSELKNNARNPSDQFTEVLMLQGEAPVDMQPVMMTYLQNHYGKQWRRPFEVFNELLLNVQHHSRAQGLPGSEGAALSCMHAQTYEGKLEISFGDLGQGIKQSLSSSPYFNFETSKEAIEEVIEKGRSRLAHFLDYEERGGGLRRALSIVQTMGGEFRLQSYDGYARLYQSTKKARFDTVRSSFPGTLVWFTVPS